MPTCKQCGEPILFKKRPGAKPYEPGAFIALETDADPHGIYAIVNDRVVFAHAGTPSSAPRHHPHAAMCSAAGRPRRSMTSGEQS